MITRNNIIGMGMNNKDNKKKSIPDEIPIIWVNIV